MQAQRAAKGADRGLVFAALELDPAERVECVGAAPEEDRPPPQVSSALQIPSALGDPPCEQRCGARVIAVVPEQPLQAHVDLGLVTAGDEQLDRGFSILEEGFREISGN